MFLRFLVFGWSPRYADAYTRVHYEHGHGSPLDADLWEAELCKLAELIAEGNRELIGSVPNANFALWAAPAFA